MSEPDHSKVDVDASEAGSTAATRRSRVRLGRRGGTLLVSLVLALVLGLLGGFVRVPYVALGPGPTFDTLGKVDGVSVVDVIGTPSYPTDGQLRMVTVSLTDDITLFGALGLWVSGRYALAPRDEYYQPGRSVQQVEQENAQDFRQSQTNAEIAALRFLRYPVGLVAGDVVAGSPADKLVLPGDRLLTVNGKPIASAQDVASALAGTKPGQRIDLSVQTGGEPVRNLQITLGSRPDRSQGFLGVGLVSQAFVPFKITISLDNVGGPSAGLVFALAIVDKLTPGGVNGGLAVAGTGTIDDRGDVDKIGGISFKLIAAREAGATVFLTPAGNCSEARSHVPDGLRLVKVTSLDSAVRELADLKAGRPVPGC